MISQIAGDRRSHILVSCQNLAHDSRLECRVEMMEFKTESQRKGCSSLLFAYGLLIWQVVIGASRPLLPTEGDETRHICSLIMKNVLAMSKLVRSAIFRVWKPSDATICQRDLPFDAPQTTPILDLPVELQLHILACLPLKQTQKCRLINRHFRELIDLEVGLVRVP